MWNAKALQRNTYLHSTLKSKGIDPSMINRCVDCAMRQKEATDPTHISDVNELTRHEPRCFAPIVLTKHARIAYGLAGVPKLISELRSTNIQTQLEALHSLEDELKDPLKYYPAILELNIAKKLACAVDAVFPISSDDQRVLEKLTILVYILASHYEGAKMLYKEDHLISNLYGMIVNNQAISRNAAKALRLMSSQPEIADFMASGDHLQRVIQVLDRVDTLEDVYLELANLIERSPGKAVDSGCFQILYPRITCNDSLQPCYMKCFALLINCREAQALCDHFNIIATLHKMLADDTLQLNTLEFTTMAMKNAIYSTRSMWRCREFWDLPLTLIKRAHSKESDQMQLWSLQALRKLTEMPSIKNYVRKVCKKKIKNISCRKVYVEKAKQILLEWLRKKQYRNPKSDEESHAEEISDSEHFGDLEKSEKATSVQDENQAKRIAYRLDYQLLNIHTVSDSSKASPVKDCIKDDSCPHL